MTVEETILQLLRANEELYGGQLVTSGRVERGSVYVTLQRMERKGLVRSRLEEPRPSAIGKPRRMYRLTLAGRAALRMPVVGPYS